MKLVPLGLLAMLMLLPGSAMGATSTWDEATHTLRVEAAVGEQGIVVDRGWDLELGAITACGSNELESDDPRGTCPSRVGVQKLDVVLVSPDQQFEAITDVLTPSGATAVTTSVSVVTGDRIRLSCSPTWTVVHNCRIFAHGSTLDLDGNGMADLSVVGAPLKHLELFSGAGDDTIDIGDFAGSLVKPKLTGPGHDAGIGNITYQIKVNSGSGNDNVATGSSNDTVDLGTGTNRAATGAGDDQAGATSGTNTIDTGPGNDTIGGSPHKRDLGNYTLIGGPGNDFIQVIYGEMHTTAGPGNDVVSHGYGRDWVDLGPGNDQTEHFKGPFTGYGGPGSDYFRILTRYGTGLTARINCGTGNDRIPVA